MAIMLLPSDLNDSYEFGAKDTPRSMLRTTERYVDELLTHSFGLVTPGRTQESYFEVDDSIVRLTRSLAVEYPDEVVSGRSYISPAIRRGVEITPVYDDAPTIVMKSSFFAGILPPIVSVGGDRVFGKKKLDASASLLHTLGLLIRQ